MNKAEKSLRWVVNQIPDFKPTTNEEKMLVAIKLYSEAGAEEIRRLEVENAKLKEMLSRVKSGRVSKLKAENAALRKQISEMVMPPCTLGDTLYLVSFCFGDGYDEAGNATHTSGWQITETKVDEKNFYKMCDLVRNGKAFFSREAAEARLAELKGGAK